jgi:hypothetical protein
VLARWREARDEYLQARAQLVGQVERQGWRAPALAPATTFVDVVFDGPPGPDAPRFVEVEDDQGRSIRYGQWLQRDHNVWVLRVPAV